MCNYNEIVTLDMKKMTSGVTRDLKMYTLLIKIINDEKTKCTQYIKMIKCSETMIIE